MRKLLPLAGGVSEAFTVASNFSSLFLARIPVRTTAAVLLVSASFTFFFLPLEKELLSRDLIPDSILGFRLNLGTTPSPLVKELVQQEKKRALQTQVPGVFYGAASGKIKTAQESLSYSKKFRMWSTSYDSTCPGCNETTALGLKTGYGVVAVDPLVIPLGSKVYIPGYGVATAGDTGAAIKGAKIDLGFDSVKKGWWSSRFTDVYLLSR